MRNTARKEKSNKEFKFNEKEDRYTRDRNVRKRGLSPLDTGAKEREKKEARGSWKRSKEGEKKSLSCS